MNYDLDKFGLSEEELFSPVDNSSLESEKITAPRYSYWHSVFRVFFKKKINIAVLCLLGVILLMTYVYPLFVEYDRFANLMNGATKHLSPSKALQQLGFNIHWILGSGASGQSTFDAVWFGSRISVSLAFICALINLSIGVIVGSVWGFSKKVDVFMMEVYNIIGNIPYVLLISVLVLIFSPSFWTMVFALTVTGWLAIAYFIRTQVVIIRDREYNLASKCLGTSIFRIAMKNILPFMTSVIVTLAATEIPSYISYEVFLAYIGMGLSDMSLGRLIYEAEGAMLTPGWGIRILEPGCCRFNHHRSIICSWTEPWRCVRPENTYVGRKAAWKDKKVLLSIKDLQVKFRVRGRILTAIRGVTLDIYENESIAIVGESGAGKSVFTKAFAGMLDSNGFIDQGDIIFNDAELSDTVVPLNSYAKKTIASTWEKLNEYSKLEYGSEVFLKMKALEQEKEEKMTLSEEEREKADAEIKELIVKRTELFNYKQTLDTSKEKARVKETSAEISRLDGEIKALQKAKEEKIKAHKQAAMNDTAYNQAYDAKMAEYKKEYAGLTAKEITDETRKRNEILAKEIYLSVGRYKLRKKVRMIKKLHEAFKAAMERGVDLNDEQKRNGVFDQATFRVRYLDETSERLHGTCIINLAKIQDPNDWARSAVRKLQPYSRIR